MGGIALRVVEVAVTAALVLSLSTIGALIATRRPENRIGWILLAAGLAIAAGLSAGWYVELSLAEPSGRLPGTEWIAWVQQWILVLGLGQALAFLPLMFPNGRLPSHRWRPVGSLAAAALAMIGFTLAFAPGKLEEYPEIENPLGLTVLEGSFWSYVNGAGWATFLASSLLSVASVVVRFRRAGGVERQQLKWFASAGALVAIGVVAIFAAYASTPVAHTDAPPYVEAAQLLLFASLTSLPIAVGVAILRYRLYEIDLLINRTLVYGSLTAILALVYLGGVVGLQGAFRAFTGERSTLAVVASTLAIAALFNPLRRRLQGFIDRRFYRKKYDAAKTLEAFSVKLRDETDLDALTSEVLGVVRETMQPAHVSLWLRPDTASKKDEAPG
ncbi:MAG: hypothetical protein M3N00_07645 [Actinomycetota bacterium]|nr:hypothetical protein [Actinomycetota bacterium]